MTAEVEEELLEKKGYRKTIVKAVKKDKNHPIHHKIKMQAHHLISAKGVQLANMGGLLAGLGYDINVLENLVLLPSTLQGACHLRVQLHRGDHTYHDDDHPKAYHEKVMVLVEKLKRVIDACSKNCASKAQQEARRKRIQSAANRVSFQILKFIEKFKVPLTRIFLKFHRRDSTGCGGWDGVDNVTDSGCPVDRNHHKQQAEGQNDEGITFPYTKQYQLKVGR